MAPVDARVGQRAAARAARRTPHCRPPSQTTSDSAVGGGGGDSGRRPLRRRRRRPGGRPARRRRQPAAAVDDGRGRPALVGRRCSLSAAVVSAAFRNPLGGGLDAFFALRLFCVGRRFAFFSCRLSLRRRALACLAASRALAQKMRSLAFADVAPPIALVPRSTARDFEMLVCARACARLRGACSVARERTLIVERRRM